MVIGRMSVIMNSNDLPQPGSIDFDHLTLVANAANLTGILEKYVVEPSFLLANPHVFEIDETGTAPLDVWLTRYNPMSRSEDRIALDRACRHRRLTVNARRTLMRYLIHAGAREPLTIGPTLWRAITVDPSLWSQDDLIGFLRLRRFSPGQDMDLTVRADWSDRAVMVLAHDRRIRPGVRAWAARRLAAESIARPDA